MKCPVCQAWTEVIVTRQRLDSKYRRYECANLHRFSTRETVERVDLEKLPPVKPKKKP